MSNQAEVLNFEQTDVEYVVSVLEDGVVVYTELDEIVISL